MTMQEEWRKILGTSLKNKITCNRKLKIQNEENGMIYWLSDNRLIYKR